MELAPTGLGGRRPGGAAPGHPAAAPAHVGILLDNVPEFMFWLAAAGISRSVVVGINPTRRGAELERDIRATDCRWIVTDTEHLPLLDGARRRRRRRALVW